MADEFVHASNFMHPHAFARLSEKPSRLCPLPHIFMGENPISFTFSPAIRIRFNDWDMAFISFNQVRYSSTAKLHHFRKRCPAPGRLGGYGQFHAPSFEIQLNFFAFRGCFCPLDMMCRAVMKRLLQILFLSDVFCFASPTGFVCLTARRRSFQMFSSVSIVSFSSQSNSFVAPSVVLYCGPRVSVATCTGFTGCTAGLSLISNPAGKTCASTTCTTSECCTSTAGTTSIPPV